MHFTSLIFLVFLAVVFALWSGYDIRRGRRLLVAASLLFYAYWFPPFVLLLLTSGLIDYVCGRRLAAADAHRKRWLVVSLAANLSILFFFKYFGLFEEAVALAAGVLGRTYSPAYDAWILPMGISFYTFQSLSYTLDIYRGDLQPTTSLSRFFAYLTFFPQLVAGPIVRARDFLPQLEKKNRLTASDLEFALHRICRGYFLKVVIADNLAGSVDRIFALPPQGLDMLTAWAGAVFFAVQIFCDFSGYSDIAIGLGRLFGFRIPENFNAPYRARSLTDFWHRWHISLSTWFRDYVYFPLGGSRRGSFRVSVNLLVVFAVSGLWHGANWTFVFWGIAHGFCLIVERAIRPSKLGGMIRSLVPEWVRVPIVFAVVCALWVPFRAQTIGFALEYWRAMVSMVDFAGTVPLGRGALFTALFAMASLVERRVHLGPEKYPGLAWRAAAYLLPVVMLPGPAGDFIYFQF